MNLKRAFSPNLFNNKGARRVAPQLDLNGQHVGRSAHEADPHSSARTAQAEFLTTGWWKAEHIGYETVALADVVPASS